MDKNIYNDPNSRSIVFDLESMYELPVKWYWYWKHTGQHREMVQYGYTLFAVLAKLNLLK